MIKLEGLIEISTGSELQVFDAFKASRTKKELDSWCEENSVFYKASGIKGYTVNGGEGKIKIVYLTTNPKLDKDKIFTQFKCSLDYFARRECRRMYSHLVSLDWDGFEYEKHCVSEERTNE